MKNGFIFFILFFSCALLAQEKKIAFGIKAGLNYGDNGKIEISDITQTSAEDRVGYHLGVFLRGRLTDNIYIKPELQYTINNSKYILTERNLDYSIKKLDLPILAGISIIVPVAQLYNL